MNPDTTQYNFLTEQIYHNTNRKYYYGTISTKTYSNLSPSIGLFSDPGEDPLLWLTTNVLYAMDYAGYNWKTHDGHDNGKIYICNITDPINIFNANSRRDLIRMIRSSGISGTEIKVLMHDDWFDISVEFRKNMISHSRKLGYQGIFNWENGTAYAPSIGLFDTSEVKIKEIIDRKDFEEVFKDQLEKGNKRILKGLLESSEISMRVAKNLLVPLSMIQSYID